MLSSVLEFTPGAGFSVSLPGVLSPTLHPSQITIHQLPITNYHSPITNKKGAYTESIGIGPELPAHV